MSSFFCFVLSCAGRGGLEVLGSNSPAKCPRIHSFLINSQSEQVTGTDQNAGMLQHLKVRHVSTSHYFYPYEVPSRQGMFKLISNSACNSSSVDIATRLRTGLWGSRVRFAAGGWEFFSSPPRPERLWSPHSLLYNGYEELFPWW
jgi:hypothetical protein